MTIGRRTALLALVILPALVAAALALRTSLNFMENAALDTVEVQVTVASQEIENWLQMRETEATDLASNPTVVDILNNDGPPAVDPGSLGVRSVIIYDATGRLVSGSSPDDRPVISTDLLDRSRDQPVLFGPARRVVRGDERLLVLVPITGNSQTGTLATELPLDGLFEAFDQETPWSSGEIVVVQPNGDGSLAPITPLRYVEDAAFGANDVIPTLTNSANRTFSASDYRGIDTTAGIQPIENTEWSVLVKADTDHVMLAPQRVRLLWIAAIIASALWGIAVLLYFARRFQSRIATLHSAVKELADGESFAPIPAEGNDELSELATTIDEVRVANLTEHERREEVERELRHQVHHDQLTGQLNRGRFMELLQNRVTELGPDRTAVLFCDLDNFKTVNDRFGHNAGDLLLVTIADRFASQMEPGELLARYGGDEFVFMCDTLNQRAETLQDNLGRTLREVVDVEGTPVVVEGSIGLALGRGREDPTELVRRADMAMYEVKQVRKNAMLPQGDRRKIEHSDDELSVAIEENELRLLYQPIIDLETDTIRGVEGLVRWRHPQFGLLDPSGIIARADRGGLLDRVDRWVFEQACKQLQAWQRGSAVEGGFTVSVNLSPPLLTDPSLVGDLASMLNAYDIDPAMIQVEITEQGLGGVEEQVNRSLAGIKALGVRIAIDDFGTLHSNLDRLRQFRADALKIDKSFVSGCDWSQETQAILSAILSVAKALDVTTIAEGIETVGERRILNDLGCAFGQGFLFGPPRSAELTAQLLNMNKHRITWPS